MYRILQRATASVKKQLSPCTRFMDQNRVHSSRGGSPPTHKAFNGRGLCYSYDRQELWSDYCNAISKGRQSPIDILTSKVDHSCTLPELQFLGWDACYDGDFRNKGRNVQFDPVTPDQAKICHAQRGTYLLRQFHMHWGRRDGEGTEHLIDGEANEVEIHFVLVKEGGTEGEEDYHAVVGVLAEVDLNMPVSGPWAQLDLKAVQCFEDCIRVSQFRYDQLLPERKGYYHYLGSLTTPPCSENVAWFLLKDRIKIPGAFLQSLRSVKGKDGKVLGYNFRKLQPIGKRVVQSSN